MAVALTTSWPAWAGDGTGARRTRLATYAFLAASCLLTLYMSISSKGIPSLDELKSQYCENPVPTEPAASAPFEPIDDEFEAPSSPAPPPSPSPSPPRHREACIDPYRRPGYLFVDTHHHNDYNNTRWIPYTTAFLDAKDPPSAEYPYNATKNGEIWFDENFAPEDELFNHPFTPTNWMDRVLKESLRRKHGKSKDERLSWVDGRVVLLISDSVDRYNIQWFCQEFSDRRYDEGAHFHEGHKPHSTAICRVPSFNFTVVHWHLAGMTTYMPAWWWDAINVEHVPFEERYDNVWEETFNDIISVDGKGPDLVIWQSTVWDRKNWAGVAKEHYGTGHPMAKFQRQLVWDEIRFYAARVKTLMGFLQDKLGKDVPMMLRTMTLDQQSMHKDIQSYDMDRINRVVGERFGVEPFEWGRLIAGQSDLYKDSLHPGKGAASWLWGTMVLEYLARAVGAGTNGGTQEERSPYFDGWSVCHDELVPIGSNAYH